MPALMHWVDWSIIGFYVVAVTAVGFLFIRRASGSTADYFVAGRNLPWWLAGTSLVATSFAADTPLFVAGLIATRGIAGNWIWWNQAIVWSLAIVFFARLWRRTGLITDAEFVETRYDGKSAAFLRGFRALYVSLIFSTGTLGWVMLAMHKIVDATLSRPAWLDGVQQSIESALGAAPGSIDMWKWLVLVSMFAVATLYTVLSGFWGIVVTDLIQFAIAMGASVLFAVFALDHAGGMAELKIKLLETFGSERTTNIFSFLPQANSQWMPISAFIVFLGVFWWGDCGQFSAQRMFSAKSERDSVLTAVWYAVAHFAIRPWPWIIVGLVALLHFPNLSDPESGYPKLMMEILPVGLRGVVIASLLAAFMSTVDTHLNWNASYFVTDIYQRFLAPGASDAQCVRVSRWAVLGYAALAIIVAYFMDNIARAVTILFNLQAGIGMVLMLRWFWWRINAWSEISAMIASLIANTTMQILDWKYGVQLPLIQHCAITVGFSTIVWVTVTFLTKPVGRDRLDAFYRKVRPARLLWGPVAARCPEVQSDGDAGMVIAGWLLGAVLLYSTMFLIGKFVLQDYGEAMIAGGVLVASGGLLMLLYRNRRSPLAP
ncbi:MAG: Na+:solute symporter [Phycisphaerales bacterium]|nr:Na+:solute symporter [Phycisphaerales bacterium]